VIDAFLPFHISKDRVRYGLWSVLRQGIFSAFIYPPVVLYFISEFLLCQTIYINFCALYVYLLYFSSSISPLFFLSFKILICYYKLVKFWDTNPQLG